MKQNILPVLFFGCLSPYVLTSKRFLNLNLDPSCDAMCAGQGLAELDREVEVERGESRYTVLSRKIAVDTLPLESY